MPTASGNGWKALTHANTARNAVSRLFVQAGAVAPSLYFDRNMIKLLLAVTIVTLFVPELDWR